jgi:Domain of unknown function (DUF4291)
MTVPESREIRADFDATTVVVYQAYSPRIADPAVRAGRFVEPFSRTRMTWIKPSFLWMMARAGWGTKPDQERVLAIRITREGLEWALANACLASYEPKRYGSKEAWEAVKRISPVRVQWDPERDLSGQHLAMRSIQIGIGGEAVPRYVDSWCVSIEDITPRVRAIHAHVQAGALDQAHALLPDERPYPLPEAIRLHVAASAHAS